MKNLYAMNKFKLLNILLVISFIFILLLFLFTPNQYMTVILFSTFILVYLFLRFILFKTATDMKNLELTVNSFDKYIIFSKTDMNGKITFANEAFCKISGYTKKELIGKSHNILRHPDMSKDFFSKIWDDLNVNKHWRGEIKNKKKNGNFYWVDAIIEAEYDASSKQIGYYAIKQNITDKKEIEQLKYDLERFTEHLETQNDEKIVEIITLNKEIKDTQKEIIFTMGTIGEMRSKETGNHVKRVAEYTKLLALYSGMHEFDADMLKQASPMHDIGKVGIPDAILNKPGRLTPAEMEIMKTHASLGFDMLKHSDKKLLGIAATIAHEHHEQYDGSGYPNGLKGKNISIEGRITAVADVFDALGSDRKYKKAWADEDIFKLLEDGKGKHFDPELVDIFIQNKEDFFAIRDKFVD